MKNKLSSVLFVCAFLVICLVPFACMSFAKSDTTSENRALASFPSIKTEDGFNTAYLKQLGEYFDDHFAFRSYFVNADSALQAKLFKTSAVERAVIGKNGWLYYSDTLDNFTGQNLLSDRALNNISHNIGLLKDYVESFGAKFIFTVAPNKNTLYPENMPYYYKKADASVLSNAEKLKPLLIENGICYVDLFELFKSTDETLYFERDSHWNGRGAALVYDALIAAAGITDKPLTDFKTVTDENYIGDLGKMVYPESTKGETNVTYDTSESFTLLTEKANEESPWIMTENKNASSSLLMYRDSFGNSLYPLFASAFQKAYFSKATPYNIQTHMTLYAAETVIAEKVERNLSDFALYPPVFANRECEPITGETEVKSDTEVKMTACETNPSLIEFTGHVDKDLIEDDSEIFARVRNGDNTVCLETFALSDEDGDNGFKLLTDSSVFQGIIELEIIIKNKDGFMKVYANTFDTSETGDLNYEQ